jgi:hypothetical protein
MTVKQGFVAIGPCFAIPGECRKKSKRADDDGLDFQRYWDSWASSAHLVWYLGLFENSQGSLKALHPDQRISALGVTATWQGLIWLNAPFKSKNNTSSHNDFHVLLKSSIQTSEWSVRVSTLI